MTRILITGSNRGIGLELVRQYAARPDTRIFATCRRPEAATALNAIATAHPDRVTVLPLDAADEHAIEAAARTVAAQTDGLDILINNAAINPRSDQSITVDAALMTETFQVNAVGPLLVTRALLPLLKAGTNVRVMNVSSQMGALQWRPGGQYGYRTSKAALNMVTRCLAMDLGSQGITTITVHPGWVQTDMGGAGATLTPQDSVSGLIRLLDGLTPTDNGEFFKWDGSKHVW
jgi:NAD(P)-dependent dehydrogenase (short-subunit alcohol dehydrogenase family)